MPSELPRQLKWNDFVAAIKRLGYSLYDSKKGSARTFRSPTREPEFVTFHEPHGSDPLRKGTLREYVRKLNLSRDEFLKLLD
jgi:predicted RNA binding protein YcfA (HicA-like mRNA interferase family)